MTNLITQKIPVDFVAKGVYIPQCMIWTADQEFRALIKKWQDYELPKRPPLPGEANFNN